LLTGVLFAFPAPAQAVDVQEVVSSRGIKAWLVEDDTVPLIAMSPSASAEDLIAALRMGVWDFLPAADQNEQGLLQMIAKHLYRCRRNGQPASYPERLEQLLSDRSIELAEKCAELKQCKAELLESQLKMRQVQNLESIGTWPAASPTT